MSIDMMAELADLARKDQNSKLYQCPFCGYGDDNPSDHCPACDHELTRRPPPLGWPEDEED